MKQTESQLKKENLASLVHSPSKTETLDKRVPTTFFKQKTASYKKSTKHPVKLIGVNPVPKHPIFHSCFSNFVPESLTMVKTIVCGGGRLFAVK